MLTWAIAWMIAKMKLQLTDVVAILLFSAIVGDIVITFPIVCMVVKLVAKVIG